jgi:anti-anti-sigma factor
VQEDFEAGIAQLALIGELDLSTVALLEERLSSVEQNGDVAIIMDLQRLEFTDCRGVSALLAAQRRASARCNYLVLMNARPEVRRLFNLSGLGHLLTPPRIPPSLFVGLGRFAAEKSETRDRVRQRAFS